MTGQTGQIGQMGQTGQECPATPASPVRLVPPAAIPKIVLPHGGYKKIIVYRKSDVIYQGTVAVCRRFMPTHRNRTVNRMTQAARSCKQNIAEGSAASGTSKESEIKLTNAARSAVRGEGWGKSIYSGLGVAVDATELMTRANEIKRSVDQAVWGIRKRKGWQ